jgi:hypothetical protein
MTTTIIVDLPRSRALDYKAMTAIRGAGVGDWCLNAFRPFVPDSDRVVLPIVVYQTNYIADQLNLITDNINIKNSAPGGTVTVTTNQNALNLIATPSPPS